jgi:hypothetical protein
VDQGEDDILSIAIDTENVYWYSAGGAVKRVPLGGGSIVTLASGTPALGATGHRYLAVDGTNVYWITPTALNAAPLAGGPTTALTALPVSGSNPNPGTLSASSIAVGGGYVYWGDLSDQIMRIPVAGGTPELLASGTYVTEIALDETNLYATSGKSVIEVPLAGGPVTTLATGTFPASIAVDADDVYWSDNGMEMHDPDYPPDVQGANVNFGMVMKTPLQGGSATTLATSVGTRRGWEASFVAVDASNVYWLENTSGDPGQVVKVPIVEGNAVTVACATATLSMAIDATSVYFGDYGALQKVTPR